MRERNEKKKKVGTRGLDFGWEEKNVMWWMRREEQLICGSSAFIVEYQLKHCCCLWGYAWEQKRVMRVLPLSSPEINDSRS